MKQRSIFIVLAVFLGTLGVHNFYLGRTTRGVIQLLITVLTFGAGAFITFPWAIVEVFTTKFDDSSSGDIKAEMASPLNDSKTDDSTRTSQADTASPGVEWQFLPRELSKLKRILSFDIMPSYRLVSASCKNGIVTITNAKGRIFETDLDDIDATYMDNKANRTRHYKLKSKRDKNLKMTIYRNGFSMEEEEWKDFEQKLNMRENLFSSLMSKAESALDVFSD